MKWLILVHKGRKAIAIQMVRFEVLFCCRYISSKRSLFKLVILILFLILLAFNYYSNIFAATRELLNDSSPHKTGLDFTIRYSARGKVKVKLKILETHFMIILSTRLQQKRSAGILGFHFVCIFSS